MRGKKQKDQRKTKIQSTLIGRIFDYGNIENRQRILTKLADMNNFQRFECENGSILTYPCSQINEKYKDFSILYVEEIHRPFLFFLKQSVVCMDKDVIIPKLK